MKKVVTKFVSPKNTFRVKKMIVSAVTALCMGAMLSITAFASSGASVNTGAFLSTVETVLKSVVILIGAGLGVWGVVNLIEGYGNDNPGAKSQGMKQLMAGLGLILLGIVMIPVLVGMMSI